MGMITMTTLMARRAVCTATVVTAIKTTRAATGPKKITREKLMMKTWRMNNLRNPRGSPSLNEKRKRRNPEMEFRLPRWLVSTTTIGTTSEDPSDIRRVVKGYFDSLMQTNVEFLL